MMSFYLLMLLIVFGNGLRKINVNDWNRTSCGPTDQITKWGQLITVDNVAGQPGIFGYPRPQTIRNDNWFNLNGLWEFQGSSTQQNINPNNTLTQQILVPFPTESCLSGVGITYKYLQYGTTFDDIKNRGSNTRVLLQFGAIDWETQGIYVNGKYIGNHTGGYDSFYFDITDVMKTSDNDLYISVYDPSDSGAQPEGKQRISAINKPGGDTYTPSSGIWQTVWIESVPSTYISKYKIYTELESVTVNVSVSGDKTSDMVTVSIFDPDTNELISTAKGNTDALIEIRIQNPKLWAPGTPNLYNMTLTLDSGDEVLTYFGLRTFTLSSYLHPGIPGVPPQENVDRGGGDLPNMPFKLSSADPNLCWAQCNKTAECLSWAYGKPNCGGEGPDALCWLKSTVPNPSNNRCRWSGVEPQPPYTAVKPALNNDRIFLAGWLDQSFWPDGIYTAPGDDALKSDLQAVLDYGLNVVRLHQKVNPERWYYWADKLGIVIFQDAVQKYGGATSATVPYFTSDITAMIEGKYNHPCIVQWTIFNEGDCWGVFNVSDMVDYVRSLDDTRLIDTDSGGGANNYRLADVFDIHDYPNPQQPIPSATQYGMIGEYGGLGAFVSGKEWVENGCYAYERVDSTYDFAIKYVNLTQMVLANDKYFTSAVIYTQITDVEEECDGYLNYDRTSKWNSTSIQLVYNANQEMINTMP